MLLEVNVVRGLKLKRIATASRGSLAAAWLLVKDPGKSLQGILWCQGED